MSANSAAKRAATRGNKKSRVWVGLHLLLVFGPLAIIITWAFTNSWPWPDLLPASWTMENVDSVLFSSGSRLGTAFGNSIKVALLVAVICMVAAALAAHAVERLDFHGKEIFRFISCVPFLVPTTVFAMGIQIMFLRAGFTGTILSVAVSHSTVALPYALAIMCDVTRALGYGREEQSYVLGGNRIQTLFSVTIPALLPGLIAAAAIAYIQSMVQYFLTILIGSGKIMTITTFMFPMLLSGERSTAAVYSIVFLLASTVVFVALEAILKRFGIKDQKNLYV